MESPSIGSSSLTGSLRRVKRTTTVLVAQMEHLSDQLMEVEHSLAKLNLSHPAAGQPSFTSMDGEPSVYRPLVNVMEDLVLRAAEKHIQKLSTEERQRVDVIDVAAYVLNRIQPLYATNRDGWYIQREKALLKVGKEVIPLVKRAIQFMKTSPERESSPIPDLPATVQADRALKQLQIVLGRKDLSWDSLVPAITQWMEVPPQPLTVPPDEAFAADSEDPE